jgi:beta-xylosidase
MKIIQYFLLLGLSFSAQAQKSGNPILPGWYADPEAIIFDQTYWIYPTYSAPYEKQVFFDAFSSEDLITWKKHPRILDTSAIKWAKKAMWAPSIIRKDGKYYFFFGANDIQSDNEVGGIGVAVADRPEGPYKDHLGKPLVDRFHHGAQPIDQFVFQDGNDFYLVFGGWKHCVMAKLNDDFTGFTTEFKEITPEKYVEGPMFFKKDGKYYFMWSEGGWTGPNYAVAYAISDNPWGPFERKGVILKQDPGIATGAGHHSVLNVGEDWYIVYHRRPLGETDRNARVTCIDKMEFDAEGNILPVKMTFDGVNKKGGQN